MARITLTFEIMGGGAVYKIELCEHKAFVFELVFDQPSLVVGRAKTADLILPSGNISRNQCEFILHENAIFVRDTMSACGTLVNNRKLPGPIPLRPGDVVKFGDWKAQVAIVETPQIPKPNPKNLMSLMKNAAQGDIEARNFVREIGTHKGLTHLGRLARLLELKPNVVTWNNLAVTLERWPDKTTYADALAWSRAIVGSWPGADRLILYEWNDPTASKGRNRLLELLRGQKTPLKYEES